VSRRWVNILLAISLVVNLFIVGAVVGVLVVRQQVLSQTSGDPLVDAANALPPAERAVFRATISARIESLRPQLRDARLARREAMSRFQTEPFDRTAASADLARARTDDQAVRGQIEEVILDFAAKLPPNQRADFAKGLSRAALARWIAAHPGRKPPPAAQ
jgi:uncharacterized membrane protein